MRCYWTLIAALFAVSPAFGDTQTPNTLTPQEIAEGWILLFDGETTFGWKCDGETLIKEGAIQVGGAKSSSIKTSGVFPDFRLRFEFLREGPDRLELIWGPMKHGLAETQGWTEVEYKVETKDDRTYIHLEGIKPPTLKRPPNRMPRLGPVDLEFRGLPASPVQLRNIKLKPLKLDALLNGKDLTDWKRFTADEKRAKSQFTVTPEGWLNVKDGPGDLQTEKQFADFVLQGECISNGKHLNSGIFFRCLPGQYQQGYEMQIRNEWKGDNRTKPVDHGTGAIQWRQAARKVVSSDNEWFTFTLVAHGRHMATWINGYPVVNWTDSRPEDENARQGCKLAAGPLSIQGHDPTTDLSFRNLRIAELK